MGYETQLLIGRDTKNSFEDEGTYFQVYANVDMCKMGNSKVLDLNWRNETPEVNHWYFYAPAGDGNTTITEDRYGDIPKPVPLKQVVEALRADCEKDTYRRFKWALALCEAMLADGGEDLSVLLWSY